MDFRKGILWVLIGLGSVFAQSDVPYGKVLKDSIEWRCCFSKGYSYFVLEDDNFFEFSEYDPVAWVCCFIDPALRRYETMRIQNRIRNDSLDRMSKARLDSLDAILFNSFPFVGPRRVDPMKKIGAYECFNDGNGYEICGHTE